VITKEIGVRYDCPVSSDKPPRIGIVNNDWDAWFAGMGITEINGGPLDGYFSPTGTHRVAELMRDSVELWLRGDEVVGETLCKVIDAKTRRHGTYTMWVAQSQGFLPLKISYEIGPDDLANYSDDRPFSEFTMVTPDGQNHSGSRATGLLDKVTIVPLGDTFVPVAGRFTRTMWYGDVRLFAVNTYKRTQINLKPRFEDTDAFVTDLPEGAIVNNMADQTSGVQYEWRGGKVMPAGTAFGGSVPVASWDPPTMVSQIIQAMLGLLFFGIGAVLAFRPKRLPQSPPQTFEPTQAA
jgi:hypothetical protein